MAAAASSAASAGGAAAGTAASGAAAGASSGAASGVSTGAKAASGQSGSLASGTTPGIPGAKPGGAPQASPSGTGQAPQSKGVPETNVSKNTPPKSSEMDSAKSELKSKDSKLDESTKEKGTSKLDEDSKQKKQKRLDSSTEEIDEEEQTDLEEGSTALLGRNKKNRMLIGCGVLSLGGIILILVIPFVFVASLSTVITGFFEKEKEVQTENNIGTNILNFMEKSNNFIHFRGFTTNEDKLYEKIQKSYDEVWLEKGIELDIPVLSATLFYDVVSDETLEMKDGVTSIDFNVNTRINQIDDLLKNMIAIQENTFICETEIVDEQTIYKTKLIEYKNVEEEEHEQLECDDKTVNTNIYTYQYLIDLDKYYSYLLNSYFLDKL